MVTLCKLKFTVDIHSSASNDFCQYSQNVVIYLLFLSFIYYVLIPGDSGW